MAIEHYVKHSGQWRAAQEPISSYQKVNGVWRANHPSDDNKMYVKVNGQWRETAVSNPPPSPGDYVLAATSLFINSSAGGTSYCEFNTTEYRGFISEIRLRVSWNTSSTDFSISGRPNGNFYRNLTRDGTWNGRTIDHRIDTFDATSLTDFNNGDAIGFTIPVTTGAVPPSINFTNLQLRLTIV